VLDAMGSWRDREGRIAPNPSKLFLVLAPDEQAAMAQARIEAAIANCVRDFHQESVGLSVQPACTAGLF
jgi:Protein of unknown function (DUF3574)